MKSLRDLHQRTPIDVRINVVLGAVAVVTIVTLVLGYYFGTAKSKA